MRGTKMNQAYKHRGKVIEVYDNGTTAAIEFSSRGKRRVECVHVSQFEQRSERTLEVGQKGWITYRSSERIGLWYFSLFGERPGN